MNKNLKSKKKIKYLMNRNTYVIDPILGIHYAENVYRMNKIAIQMNTKHVMIVCHQYYTCVIKLITKIHYVDNAQNLTILINAFLIFNKHVRTVKFNQNK